KADDTIANRLSQMTNATTQNSNLYINLVRRVSISRILRLDQVLQPVCHHRIPIHSSHLGGSPLPFQSLQLSTTRGAYLRNANPLKFRFLSEPVVLDDPTDARY